MNKKIFLILFFVIFICILSFVFAIPLIEFTDPTPPNEISTTNTSIIINVSLIESKLANLTYNWNNTNFTVYDNSSLVLMMNFNNISELEENDTYVIDMSKYGNNGTLINGPIWNSSGKYGTAMQFDGIDDYVNVPNSNSLNVSFITISGWIKANSFIDDGASFATKGNGNGGEVWSLDFVPNRPRFYFWKGGSPYTCTGSAVLSTNQWNHVVGTYNGTDILVYVNGIINNNCSAPQGALSSNTHIVSIGSRQSGSGAYDLNFNGTIDEVRVWNRSLSAQEIYQQYISNLQKYNENQWYLYVNQSKNATNSLDIGNYTYFVSAKDNSNNEAISELRTIEIQSPSDTEYPIFSDYWDNNRTLIDSGTGLFNVTVTSTNGTVWLEINNTNYTAKNLTENVYNVSVSDMLNGTYFYRWHSWGNGTDNNYNVSEERSYTINASVPVALTNINLDWIYPTTNINVSQNEFFNITINVSCSGGNCGEINISLDPTTPIYNFTTCNQTGRLGPNQTQCDSNYSGTSLQDLVNISEGIQNWTVPYTGTYTIEVAGARGGVPTGALYSKGALIKGDFNLTKGTVLKILVGQQGLWGPYNGNSGCGGSNDAGGGGGGSFVVYANNTPLIIAGGGGGYNSANNLYTDAVTNNTGVTPGSSSPGVKGINGGGGGAGTSGSGGNGITNGGDGGSCAYGAGGGGLLSNGGRYCSSTANSGGFAFINGGYGGNQTQGCLYAHGGFGGGGAGGHRSAGGGGYSGGGGCGGTGGGGGGGSYNTGSNQTNLSGINTGDGYISIMFIGSVSSKNGIILTNDSATPFYTNTTNPYNLTLNENQSQIITWFVNATGTINTPYEFFIYANQTSNQSIGNITSKLNITIKDTINPIINITYPLNTTYPIVVTDLNYDYSDINVGYCWYSTDSGATNSTPVSAGINFTNLSSSGGSNTWTVYCNDSSGNLDSNSITFTSSVPVVTLTLLSPTTDINVTQNQFFEVRARVSCLNNNCGEINVTLDPEINIQYNFTTCGASGSSGPSQANCNSNYSGTSLEGLVNVNGGIQNWTVPATGTYSIEVVGAQGGKSTSEGGLGAYMYGEFSLTAGEVIKIIVGQKGISGNSGGGGGGTFVAFADNEPLIIAGGGGGAYYSSYSSGLSQMHGTNSTNGQLGMDAGNNRNASLGGSNGTGGGSQRWYTNVGAGGGGFTGNGTNGPTAVGGRAFISGGDGGLDAGSAGAGGFGGGGGGDWYSMTGGGGGGGYSGGGGGEYYGLGGGGGSFNSGVNQINLSGVNTGNGYVSITFTGGKGGTVSNNPTTIPFWTNITNPYNVTLNQGDSATISWWVNATGGLNETYEFFVYANMTSDLSTGDITATWNVTTLSNGSYISGIDESPPTITFNSPNNNSFSSDTGLDIDLTISDPNLDSCWYSNDSMTLNISLGTGGSCTDITSITWTEGQHVLTVWANDTGGYEANSSLTFTIDTINPFINYETETDQDNLNISKNNIYVKVSVTEINEANITFSLYYSNGSLTNKTTYSILARTINWTGLLDNTYKFNVTVYDNASNSASTITRTINLDTTPPLITINLPVNQTYITLSINSQISSNETLNSCIVSFDNWASNQTMTLNESLTGANFTKELASDGSYTTKFSCIDLVGNINNTESVDFSIDTTNPVINIDFPLDNQYFNYNESISLNYTILTDDTDSCWYSLDNGENQSIPGCINLSLNLSEGNHLIRLGINDSVNLQGSDNVNFTIDLTSPLISLITPLNNTLNNTANRINFYYNVSDTNTIVNCSLIINNLLNATVNNPRKEQTNNITSYLLNGNYYWIVNCTDIANNINSSETRYLSINYSVKVDNSKFDGNTTLFPEIIDTNNLTNIPNLTIEKSGYGKVNFLENVDLSQNVENFVINISKNVNISFNRIEVNSTILTSLNKSARLTLYNLTFSDPQVLKDENVCTDCNEVSYSEGIFIFDVTGFTTYYARETPITPDSVSISPGGSRSKGSYAKPELEKCFTDWICTPWSFCSANLTQVRVCNKENSSCNAGEKPEEIRYCPDVLFDVKIDLLKNRVMPWSNLKLKVDLEEVNKSELVDVEIIYRIITNDKTVWEERETISIQDSKTYIKEIDNLELPAGTYFIQVIINYGKNQTAGSINSFKVIGLESLIFYLALLIALLFLGLIAYNKYKERKDEDKIRKFLEKLELKRRLKESLRREPYKFYTPIFKKESLKEELLQEEKDILTLVNGIPVYNAEGFITRFVSYPRSEINRVIDKLRNLGLLEIIKIGQGELQESYYYHTSKVKKEMINDTLRFKRDFGWNFKNPKDLNQNNDPYKSDNWNKNKSDFNNEDKEYKFY